MQSRTQSVPKWIQISAGELVPVIHGYPGGMKLAIQLNGDRGIDIEDDDQ